MTTYTSQPDDTTGVDTYIKKDTANTNYGTSNILVVGEYEIDEDHRTLLKFDLSTIPSSATITSAILYITQIGEGASSTRTMRVYRSKRAWVESQATWNIYSTGNNWQTAGGFGSNDCEQTDIGSISLSSSESNGQKAITLTASAIQDMINGTFTNNGFLLKMDTETGDGHAFASSTNATASYRPKLVIEYTAGGPTGVKKVSSVAVADIKKISSVALASIKKVSGVG